MMDIHNSLNMNTLSLICVQAEGCEFISAINCDTTDANGTLCTVSITNFCDQYYTTSVTEKMTVPKECTCNTDIGPSISSYSELTSDGVTIINGLSTGNSSNSTIIAVLGALVGLLLVLLVIVTTGLVWTCRSTAGKKTNSDQPW